MNIGVHLTSTFLKHYTYLHEHPELSFGEQNTTHYIRNVLEAESIMYEKAGTTGVIGYIRGQNSEATIALRADMDALPIQESADAPCGKLHTPDFYPDTTALEYGIRTFCSLVMSGS